MKEEYTTTKPNPLYMSTSPKGQLGEPMSIIIKGMEKPKECGKCPISAREKICGGATTDCPLIEIVECKDCKWADSCKALDIYLDGFCSKGERRTDE